MPYTDDQAWRMKFEFVKMRRRQSWAAGVLAAGCVLVSLCLLVPALRIPSAIYKALPVVVLGFLVFTAMNWRCPGCNRYLGNATWGLAFCQNCGARLK